MSNNVDKSSYNEAVKYIQEHWNDTEFNIDYKKCLNR